MDQLQSTVTEAIRLRDFPTLRLELKRIPPSVLAELIKEMPEDMRIFVFRCLPRELAADAFEYLSLDGQEELLKSLGQRRVSEILNEMAPDDRTSLLDELPGNVTIHLLQLLNPEERAIAIKLLGYRQGSVGRLMTTDYISLHPNWSVTRSLDHIRMNGKDSETLSMVYVVDEKGLLIDDIRIRKLLLSPLERPIFELMDHIFISLKATDDQEKAVEKIRTSDLTALPVTDTEGVLIGIVTIDDLLDVAEREATEDIQKFGGLQALDEPYMTISLFRMVKKRASWLVLLFIGEMFTATAMGYFEGEIAKAVVLALFIPLIISSGGNSGSQAATLVIRAMALKEVTIRDWWHVFNREIFIGFLLGLILGSIGFLRISVWSFFTDIYGEHWAGIAVTLGLALIGIVLWGTLIGSMLPFILRIFKLDPAASSAPLVATFVDVTGLIIYFGVATWVLSGTLL